MIDAKDKKTVDLLPVPKKRGRPATGKAMTAAERKRLQRQRNQDACPPGEDLTKVPLEALYRKLSKFIGWGDDVLMQEVFAELLRRAREVESTRASTDVVVTVTEKPVEVADVTVTKKEIWPLCGTVTKKSKVAYALGDDTWTGRGKRPQWVVDALGRGMTLMDLLIK